MYCTYEACRNAGVKRVVFASTNHVTGLYEEEGMYTTPEMPVRPDSLYGASKAFGESLGRYYVDRYGLEVVCLRIGSFQPDSAVVERKSDRILSTWLSHRDCVQLVQRSIEADVRFGIYYGISGNTRAYWDLQNARRELGYAPQDNSEHISFKWLVDRIRSDPLTTHHSFAPLPPSPPKSLQKPQTYTAYVPQDIQPQADAEEGGDSGVEG